MIFCKKMAENAIKCSETQFLTENSNLTNRASNPSIQAFACSITALSFEAHHQKCGCQIDRGSAVGQLLCKNVCRFLNHLSSLIIKNQVGVF